PAEASADGYREQQVVGGHALRQREYQRREWRDIVGGQSGPRAHEGTVRDEVGVAGQQASRPLVRVEGASEIAGLRPRVAEIEVEIAALLVEREHALVPFRGLSPASLAVAHVGLLEERGVRQGVGVPPEPD